MHQYLVISSPEINRLRMLPDPSQQRGEEEGGDFFLQGRMDMGQEQAAHMPAKMLGSDWRNTDG